MKNNKITKEEIFEMEEINEFGVEYIVFTSDLDTIIKKHPELYLLPQFADLYFFISIMIPLYK